MALRGPICVGGRAHAAASWATSSDCRHPTDDLSSGASASGSVRAGARLARIWENLEVRSGAGTKGATVSRRYTMEEARSLLTMPWVVDMAWPSRARRAAKYAVAVKSACWSRSVSSTAERTTEVCNYYYFCILASKGFLLLLSILE